MANMENGFKFLHEYCTFDEPDWLWIITGLSRNKDNSDGSHKFLRRMTVANHQDIDDVYTELHRLCYWDNTTYRMYVSLNARNSTKAFFNYQKKLMDVAVGLAQGREDSFNLSKKAGSLWKTELAQTQNRATKRVLLDVDTMDTRKIQLVKAQLLADRAVFRADHQTPNGHVFVVDAYDTRGLIDFAKREEILLDLQRDSMVFVEQW